MCLCISKSSTLACILFGQRDIFRIGGRFSNFLPNNPMFNSLPNDKILDWSKLKAFADAKINVTQMLKFVFTMVENIVGKEENAGYHFLLSLQCFQKFFFSVSIKVVNT